MSLDAIYQEFEQKCQRETEIQAAKQRQEKTERYNAAAARLASALDEWPLLSQTLGLGVTIREGDNQVYIKGKTNLQGFDLITELRTGYGTHDLVAIWIGTQDQGVFLHTGDIYGCIWEWPYLTNQLARKADELLGKLKQAAAAEQERQAQAERQLQEAQTMIALAQEYSALWESYQERCRIWANDWTAQLWEPWELYRVRYTAIQGEPYPEIETIYCMDNPLDIVMTLHDNKTAEVDVVEMGGTVTMLTIASFLDAKQVCMEGPTILLAWDYHRSYKAGNYYVNVPAWDLREPQGAPEAIVSWSDYVGQRAGDDLKYQLYRYQDWLILADADPKELVAELDRGPF